MKGSGKFSNMIGGARETTSAMTDRVIGGTSQIAQHYKLSEQIDIIRQRLDDNTPGLVKDASNKMMESIDTLTGIKLLEVVQEMLQVQEAYNDILATKLDEALTRIAVLEAAIQHGPTDED